VQFIGEWRGEIDNQAAKFVCRKTESLESFKLSFLSEIETILSDFSYLVQARSL
jgi:hypothetical protein